MEEYKIEVFAKDEEDNCFCAIVMRFTGSEWVNTGIVIRDKEASAAFSRACRSAKAVGFWG